MLERYVSAVLNHLPYYRERTFVQGSVIIQDGDQYATDLQKSFKAIAKFRPEIKVCPLKAGLQEISLTDRQQTILLLGGLTGRLDQTIHTLHFLTKMRQSDFTIWAFSEQSMACVIDKVMKT